MKDEMTGCLNSLEKAEMRSRDISALTRMKAIEREMHSAGRITTARAARLQVATTRGAAAFLEELNTRAI